MKKSQTNFVCSECGYSSSQWYGKCPSCSAWNSMQEFREQRDKKGKKNQRDQNITRPQKLSEIKTSVTERFSSGMEEFDRVLGGGFINGSVSLLAGEPGVGKSTLLLELAREQKDPSSAGSGKASKKILYISGEESVEQIKMRAERLGVDNKSLLLLAETNTERIIEEIGEFAGVEEPGGKLVIIDSVQTLWSEAVEGEPGSVSQVKGCALKLIEFAKKNNVTIILVGHVTKGGEVAGPMMLSHMVDVVLFLEGERFADLRLLRGIKNRFGPTDEVGVFRMVGKGMEEVRNPSELFLEGFGGSGTNENRVGNVIICAMEGSRPMLVEIQALVTQSALAIPRRVASGVDYNRVLLLAAVLQKSLNLPLYSQDIIVKVAGGFKVDEPAADLGICLAIISSFKNLPIGFKTCVFGEVGLLGEIRRVNGEEKRKKEATKLGFIKILSSETVKNLREAVKTIGN